MNIFYLILSAIMKLSLTATMLSVMGNNARNLEYILPIIGFVWATYPMVEWMTKNNKQENKK